MRLTSTSTLSPRVLDRSLLQLLTALHLPQTSWQLETLQLPLLRGDLSTGDTYNIPILSQDNSALARPSRHFSYYSCRRSQNPPDTLDTLYPSLITPLLRHQLFANNPPLALPLQISHSSKTNRPSVKSKTQLKPQPHPHVHQIKEGSRYLPIELSPIRQIGSPTPNLPNLLFRTSRTRCPSVTRVPRWILRRIAASPG